MDYHWIKIFEKEENDDDYLLKNTFINLELKGEKRFFCTSGLSPRPESLTLIKT
jgi:hypothetical protein